MKYDDIDTIRQHTTELKRALDEMRTIHEDCEKESYNVDETAFEDAQEQAKDAISAIINNSDEMVDETDVFETPNGETVSLPNPALERSQSRELPDPPGGS